MAEPLFWLGFSLLLVAIALTAVLVVLIPAVQELARAARSAEKLFDTLNRELPPTLESIRLTGLEITDLTDEVSQGVEGANRVVQQVDQSLLGVRQQAKRAQRATRGFMAGFKAAWSSLTESPRSNRRSPEGARETNRLPASTAAIADWEPEYDTEYEADLEADLIEPSATASSEAWTSLNPDRPYDRYDDRVDDRSAEIPLSSERRKDTTDATIASRAPASELPPPRPRRSRGPEA